MSVIIMMGEAERPQARPAGLHGSGAEDRGAEDRARADA